MDDKRGGRLEPLSTRRLVALLIAILALTVVVASASRPGEAGPATPPSSAETGAAVIRAGVILFVIVEAVVLGLVAWALWPEGTRRRFKTRRGTLVPALASFLQAAAALILFFLYAHYRSTIGGATTGFFALFGTSPALPRMPDGHGTTGAGQAWVTGLLVVAVVAVAAAFLLRGVGIRRRRSPLATLAGQLREAVEEGLEELEAETDPRRAVIAAYARMEVALARVGMPRAGHEAALEYLDRLLALLDARGPAARRLTELFQLAKFSDHVINPEMKRDAIRALVDLRDELRVRAAEDDLDPLAVPA